MPTSSAGPGEELFGEEDGGRAESELPLERRGVMHLKCSDCEDDDGKEKSKKRAGAEAARKTAEGGGGCDVEGQKGEELEAKPRAAAEVGDLQACE